MHLQLYYALRWQKTSLCRFRGFKQKIVKRDRFPLLLVQDKIDRLRGKNYFSRRDLKDAFCNVKLADNSTEYTSFVTPQRQYEFLRLPFEFCNSPAIFSRFIGGIFREMIDEELIQIYLDDILVATETVEENLEILKLVFHLLILNSLELKFQKCSFLQSKINFLGYIVDKLGIQPNSKNAKAVLNFPIPSNVRRVQSFLGLASYFRRFIANFFVVAKPL